MGMSLNTGTIQITPDILSVIAEIDEFKGEWKALETLAPERLSALRRVATIESIGSSTRIEGSKLSDSEVDKIFANIEIQEFQTRDEQEVAGYADVIETVFSSAGEITLSENHIKQLHRDLMGFSEKDERHRGEYKTHDNHVSAFDSEGNEIGIVFKTATPFDTPKLMSELIEWTTTSLDQKKLHPLLVVAVYAVVFLEIHPFQDGNGRLSRILTTLLLLQNGYRYVPYSSLESVIEQSKESYYLALRSTQKTIRSNSPDWQSWIVFFLRSLQQQKERLKIKMDNEKLLLMRLPPLSLEILDLVKKHGQLKNSQIVEITGANRNTVKKHLMNLVSSNQLVKQGVGRGTVYVLKSMWVVDEVE